RSPEPVLLIAENSTAQEIAGLLAHRTDARELDFEIQGVGYAALDVVHITPRQQAPGDATTVVLDADEGLQGLAIEHRVVPASDQTPGGIQRNQHRGIDLFEQVAAETVRQVGHAFVAEAI